MKILIIDTIDTKRTRYAEHKQIGSFMLGRSLQRYEFLMCPEGKRKQQLYVPKEINDVRNIQRFVDVKVKQYER